MVTGCKLGDIVRENIKILIVDDNKDLADGVALVFELEGFSVDVVYSGNDAIHKLKNNLFDVAFVDIKMPDISGFKIMSECKKTVKTKVVLMTGYRLEQMVSEIFKKCSVVINRESEFSEQNIDEFYNDKERCVAILTGDAAVLNHKAIDYCSKMNIDAYNIYSEKDIENITEDYSFIIISIDNTLIDAILLLDEIKNMISGKAKVMIIVNAMNAGMKNVSLNSFPVAGCLFKPVDPSIMLNVVNQITAM